MYSSEVGVASVPGPENHVAEVTGQVQVHVEAFDVFLQVGALTGHFATLGAFPSSAAGLTRHFGDLCV